MRLPPVPLAIALLLPCVACDLETAPEPSFEPEAVRFRGRGDGECASFTTTVVTTTHVKRGYPPPDDYLTAVPFGETTLEWQLAFEADLEEHASTILEAIYLDREGTASHCDSVCAELGMGWDGGTCVFDLDLAHGEPEPRFTGYNESLVWRTDVEASGAVSCTCN